MIESFAYLYEVVEGPLHQSLVVFHVVNEGVPQRVAREDSRVTQDDHAVPRVVVVGGNWKANGMEQRETPSKTNSQRVEGINE